MNTHYTALTSEFVQSTTVFSSGFYVTAPLAVAQIASLEVSILSVNDENKTSYLQNVSIPGYSSQFTYYFNGNQIQNPFQYENPQLPSYYPDFNKSLNKYIREVLSQGDSIPQFDSTDYEFIDVPIYFMSQDISQEEMGSGGSIDTCTQDYLLGDLSQSFTNSVKSFVNSTVGKWGISVIILI